MPSEDAKAPTLIVPKPKPKNPVIVCGGKDYEQEHPDRACETCDHAYFSHPDQTGGHCRIEPPKQNTFLLPPTIQGQIPRDMTVCSWAIVHRPQFCGTGYRRKVSAQQ